MRLDREDPRLKTDFFVVGPDDTILNAGGEDYELETHPGVPLDWDQNGGPPDSRLRVISSQKVPESEQPLYQSAAWPVVRSNEAVDQKTYDCWVGKYDEAKKEYGSQRASILVDRLHKMQEVIKAADAAIGRLGKVPELSDFLEDKAQD